MTLSAWRIVKAKRLPSAFTGEGSRIRGGRWNSKGTAVVYAAQSVALAALEMLVHLEADEILDAYSTVRVRFDAEMVESIDLRRLPANWRDNGPVPELRALGDAWVQRGRTPVLRVPSAVVEGESNYILNVRHAEFARIRIETPRPFHFDRRLGRRAKA